MWKPIGSVGMVGFVAWCAACSFPRPADVSGPEDAGGTADGSSCAVNQALRCEGTNLIRCDGRGTSETSETCALGCNASALRCNDVEPSNGLAQYLDLASSEPDLDLGTTATINTNDGTVMVDGRSVTVRSALMAQTSAPTILVFIARSVAAHGVVIGGSNAFAFVSNGDFQIGGLLSASAKAGIPGAGRFNDGACVGGAGDTSVGQAAGGCGGGGFGSAGGRGGSAANANGTAFGGTAGMPTGNPTLIPLRGGCDSGRIGGTAGFGAGGGAIQIVSRSKIVVSGVIAANGSSIAGGGSGGGILLEAPVVDVSGAVVANGGAGAGGCILPQMGEDGRLDASPSMGGLGCGDGGNGGAGGAGNSGAANGVSVNVDGLAFGGYGGGSVGRIRINTAPGGLHRTLGLFSPNPSTGTVGIR